MWPMSHAKEDETLPYREKYGGAKTLKRVPASAYPMWAGGWSPAEERSATILPAGKANPGWMTKRTITKR